ncbi:hypothetical protein ACW4YW_12130 [Methylobacillus pratensis]
MAADVVPPAIRLKVDEETPLKWRSTLQQRKTYALSAKMVVNKIHSLKNPVKTGTFIACSTLPAIYKPAATLYNSLIQAMQAILAASANAALEMRRNGAMRETVNMRCSLPLSRS